MTPLGKPLVFYLKYMAEMERLYGHAEGEEPDLTGLDNPEQVLEMARSVGDAAGNHAADFLELCKKVIEDHFIGLGIATPEKPRSRAYVANYWDWGERISIPSIQNAWFGCGVWITSPLTCGFTFADDACGLVVPWIWMQGGRKAEDAASKILSGRIHSRAGDGVVEESGTVALACIPIRPYPPESFDVDRDELLSKVKETIALIGVVETKALAKFVAGR